MSIESSVPQKAKPVIKVKSRLKWFNSKNRLTGVQMEIGKASFKPCGGDNFHVMPVVDGPSLIDLNVVCITKQGQERRIWCAPFSPLGQKSQNYWFRARMTIYPLLIIEPVFGVRLFFIIKDGEKWLSGLIPLISCTMHENLKKQIDGSDKRFNLVTSCGGGKYGAFSSSASKEFPYPELEKFYADRGIFVEG